MKALTVDGHNGYQKWHRLLDDEILKAIGRSSDLLGFQKEINKLYNMSEIVEIFGKINIVL